APVLSATVPVMVTVEETCANAAAASQIKIRTMFNIKPSVTWKLTAIVFRLTRRCQGPTPGPAGTEYQSSRDKVNGMSVGLKLLAMLLMAAMDPLLTAGELRTLPDVVYGHASGEDLRLDAFLCNSAKATPVVIYIHGGGWRQGDKRPNEKTFRVESEILGALKTAMQSAGVAVVSINYRLSDVAAYTAQVDDVTRAVQFVRHQASKWRLDARRVAVFGASAGAHLALWIGLHPDRANPKSSDPVERESTRVRCIVNYYGVTDFHLVQQHPDAYRIPAFRQLFGYT